MWSSSVVINSREDICFLAMKEENGAGLFCLDKNGNEIVAEQILSGFNPSYSSELVMDNNNNIYFSVDDNLIKFGEGGLLKKQFTPEYASGYQGDAMAARLGQVYVSFDGNILFSANNGKYIQPNQYIPRIYAIDNNFSQIVWSKDNYQIFLGFNEEEAYYLRTDVRNYIGAINVSNGNNKWERLVRGGVSQVVSDSSNKIYFTRSALFGANLIFGYDSNSMPEDLEISIFYLYNQSSFYSPFISLSSGATFFSDTQRFYKIDI
jgi:hypothetical protein